MLVKLITDPPLPHTHTHTLRQYLTVLAGSREGHPLFDTEVKSQSISHLAPACSLTPTNSILVLISDDNFHVLGAFCFKTI